MADQDAALRRLAGMLGPDAFERLGKHRGWMGKVITRLSFLEDVGFMVWADGRADADGRVPWSVTYHRRLLEFQFLLDPRAHRVVATFHQPTRASSASDGWSLGPPLELGPAFASTGASTTGLERDALVLRGRPAIGPRPPRGARAGHRPAPPLLGRADVPGLPRG